MIGQVNDNPDDPPLGPEAGIPLAGGNASATVVRVGDTVRRTPGSRHSGVPRLLDHLAASDFDASPHHLGRDAYGREVLSFLHGDTRQPATFWEDLAAAEAAARLLRRFHDAAASLQQHHKRRIPKNHILNKSEWLPIRSKMIRSSSTL